MFVHSHNHSVFSARDGMLKIEDMVKRSIEHGEAFALTDHGSIGGWRKYSELAKKNNIKPIFGIELYINPFRDELLKTVNKINCMDVKENEDLKDDKKELTKKRDELKKYTGHLIMIAKNEVGFYNIIQLINDAYINYFYSKPLVDWDSILSMKKDKDGTFGVIITTACLAGPISKFINFGKKHEAEDWINNIKEYFHDDFYLEVQANDIEEQRILNKFIIELADQTKTKIVIGSDAHYLEPEDADTHQDLLLLQNKNVRSDVGQTDTKIFYENKNGETKTKKVKEGKEFRKGVPFETLKPGMNVGKDIILKIEETPRVWTFTTDKISFKSFKEIVKDIHQFHHELIPVIKNIEKNNSEIYDKIDYIKFNSDIKLPVVENASEIFVDIIKTKMKEKGLTERKYVDRIKYELNIIKKFGFEAYFLILYDVLNFAKTKNIGIGNGRGSVVSSLIAFVMDLHNMDPFDERYNNEGECLPFERFLSLDKLYNTIIVEDENGKKHMFLEIDEIKIKRNKSDIIIKASEIQEGDEISL